MVSNLTISPEADRSYTRVEHSSVSTPTVVRASADTRFLYGLLWALIGATILAGWVAATLAAALVSVPAQLRAASMAATSQRAELLENDA